MTYYIFLKTKIRKSNKLLNNLNLLIVSIYIIIKFNDVICRNRFQKYYYNSFEITFLF